MNTTPASLLERLRSPAQQADWDRFVVLYTPLLCMWARRLGQHGPDMEDLVQDVLAVVVQQIPAFQYDRQRRFRGWLWTILSNRVRASRRRVSAVVLDNRATDEVADATPTDDLEEAEYRNYLVHRLLPLIQDEFQPVTWKVFQAIAVQGRAPAEVAQEFGMSVPAVYAVKSRVLRRIRTELADLLD